MPTTKPMTKKPAILPDLPEWLIESIEDANRSTKHVRASIKVGELRATSSGKLVCDLLISWIDRRRTLAEGKNVYVNLKYTLWDDDATVKGDALRQHTNDYGKFNAYVAFDWHDIQDKSYEKDGKTREEFVLKWLVIFNNELGQVAIGKLPKNEEDEAQSDDMFSGNDDLPAGDSEAEEEF